MNKKTGECYRKSINCRTFFLSDKKVWNQKSKMNKLGLIVLFLFSCFYGTAVEKSQLDQFRKELRICRTSGSAFYLLPRVDMSELPPDIMARLDSVITNKWSERELQERADALLNSKFNDDVWFQIYSKKVQDGMRMSAKALAVNKGDETMDSVVYQKALIRMSREEAKKTIVPPFVLYYIRACDTSRRYVPLLISVLEKKDSCYDAALVRLILAHYGIEPYQTEEVKRAGFDETIQDIRSFPDLCYIGTQDAIYEIAKTLSSKKSDVLICVIDNMYGGKPIMSEHPKYTSVTKKENGVPIEHFMSPVKYKYVQALYNATVNFPLNVNEVQESYLDNKDFMYDENSDEVFNSLRISRIPVSDKYMDVLIKWYKENKGKSLVSTKIR
jgi:hypothetical protein